MTRDLMHDLRHNEQGTELRELALDERALGSCVTLPRLTDAEIFADYEAEMHGIEPPHVTDTLTWREMMCGLGWWFAGASLIGLSAMLWALVAWTLGGLR